MVEPYVEQLDLNFTVAAGSISSGLYGVTGIPMAVLVGKDGKVITLNARGPALGKHLEELLGKPEPVEAKTPAAGTEK